MLSRRHFLITGSAGIAAGAVVPALAKPKVAVPAIKPPFDIPMASVEEEFGTVITLKAPFTYRNERGGVNDRSCPMITPALLMP